MSLPWLERLAGDTPGAGSRLGVPEAPIEPSFLGQELVVPSALNDMPPVHHPDLVGPGDGPKPVRDHQQGPSLCQAAEGRLDLSLVLEVDARRRLVEPKR